MPWPKVFPARFPIEWNSIQWIDLQAFLLINCVRTNKPFKHIHMPSIKRCQKLEIRFHFKSAKQELKIYPSIKPYFIHFFVLQSILLHPEYRFHCFTSWALHDWVQDMRGSFAFAIKSFVYTLDGIWKFFCLIFRILYRILI